MNTRQEDDKKTTSSSSNSETRLNKAVTFFSTQFHRAQEICSASLGGSTKTNRAKPSKIKILYYQREFNHEYNCFQEQLIAPESIIAGKSKNSLPPEVIEKSKTITKIVVISSFITDHDAEIFSNLIAKYPSIEIIHFTANKHNVISDSGLANLIKALTSNVTLKHLTFDSQFVFGQSAMEALIAAIENNRTPEYLKLSFQFMDKSLLVSFFPKLNSAFRNNTSLKNLDIEGVKYVYDKSKRKLFNLHEDTLAFVPPSSFAVELQNSCLEIRCR